ncbi:MFS transporter [Ectothiorhodospira haloalkaliphila]|uniref:MFS transporter n=1 Tax=Ectothiorhodospira haloalkaliphila TaxID=421628 RepID=UPI001EE7E5F2|nr:MFS transporter [Ectothiorhodospira haloalkaliphila]MCG5525595.1 MFS transporter [Ectothiorhodospira haloalkaliphila]
MKPLSPLGMATLGGGIIAITYGLARFVFGLFLPEMRQELTITPTMAGVIGSLPFLSFAFAIVVAPWITRRLGVRRGAVTAAGLATLGLLTISQAPSALFLAAGVLICGISTGLSSPVMAQAVHRVVPSHLRGRVNATINAGTSLGIALAMPAVLIWAEAWRSAYVGFAALAAVGVLAALVYLPRDARPASRSSDHTTTPPIHWMQWLAISRLSGMAFAMGLVSAAYWVFAPDAVITSGGLVSSQTAWMWLAVGLGGMAGFTAGDLISRFGPALSHAGGLTVMAAAIGLLALNPGSFALALTSAALFGVGYMILTGFYLVRSIQIMDQAPALGPVMPLLATSLGQVAGSPLAGWLVDTQGHVTTFMLFAIVGVSVAWLFSWLLNERGTAVGQTS